MATHIIASAMPPKKAADFAKYRVVKPAWVMDSIKAGKPLPWTDYRVIDDSPRQKTIKFDRGKMFSQATQQSSTGYREQTEDSFYTSQLQKSTDGLEPQASSSPFRLKSAAKPSQLELEGVDDDDDDDADDMDVDTPAERPLTLELGTEDASVTSTGRPSTSEDKLGVLTGSEPRGLPKQPPGKPMTSEEHNAMLLSDPKIRKSSTANPDFLKQYYSESRLHHLSTWKAQLKSRLQSLAAEKASAAKRIKRTSVSRRYIMHVDFDSFFCAVSLKNAPDYRDKPAVVAHSTGSGSEIASCNYPARKFGVKNGMWMKRALELCPDLKILPYDFPAYEEASRQFYDAILAVGGVVQSVSIDEALVDTTDIVLSDPGPKGVGISESSVWREQERADEIASNLRAEIQKKTDCHVSVGIGANILLAKIALRKAKPAGQHQIRPEEVLDILGDLKVEDLPGVAYSIGGKLEEIGVKLVKDIRQTSKERLISVLGPKTGEKLWDYARGIDRTEVGEQPIRKSVSADVNWGIRFISQAEAEEFVYNLCKELESRLLNEGVKGKNLTMKIMRRALDAPLDPAKHLGHGKCDTFTKSITFGVATSDAGQIGKEAVAILRSFKFSPGDLRGLGVQMTKLEPLKPSAAPDGSQKKLNFGNLATAPVAKRTTTEPIDDDISLPNPRRSSGQEFEQDPITVDPLTPRKPKVHPALALARANAADEKANSPLNVMGTQFIIPSNPDPAVLAELPHDIRSRLVNQAKAKRVSPATTAPQSRDASPAVKSRSHSPALTTTTDEVDIPPDVDPEVFNALPEEMQAEVLASYGGRKQQQRQGKIDGHGQTTRPQSAHSDRVTRLPKEKSAPAKRGGGGGGSGGIKGMFSRAKERERQQDAEVGLRQTSFATGGQQQQQQQAGDDEWIGDLDPDVLAELPEDVRREVVEDHRRQRLAQRPGPSYHQPPAPPRQGGAATDEEDTALPRGQTRLTFPAKPPKAMFTQSGLTSFQEIKNMLGVWHNATREEGPHRADVEVFERYVKKVVGEERDMEKARKLVKWLEWVVEEGAAGKGRVSWREALESVKVAVQGAMEERGLGAMDFG